MGTVAGHALSAFTTPVNGSSPIDANQVRGNDNSIGTSYNAHDADATIHLQNSAVASRPAAATAGAGAMWLATDVGAKLITYSDGSSWFNLNYVQTDSTGAVVITSTTGPQLSVRYDASNKYTASVSSAGAVTFDAVGASASFTFSDAVTVSGTLSVTDTATFDGSAKGLAVRVSSANDRQVRIYHDGTNGVISSTFGSTGAYTPLVLRTSDTAAITIATNQAVTFAGAVSGITTLATSSAITAGAAFKPKRVSPTYGATVTIDASLGNMYVVTITDANNFTMAAPTNPTDGQIIVIVLRNTSAGSSGTITWPTTAGAWGTSSVISAVGAGNSGAVVFFYVADANKWLYITAGLGWPGI